MSLATMETQPATNALNPCGITGLAFLEYAGPDAAAFDRTFRTLGLSPARTRGAITHYQGDRINFLLNDLPSGFARDFANAHGQSACGVAFEVADPQFAYDEAIRRGAKALTGTDLPYPAVEGVGGSAIYFVTNFQQTSSQAVDGWTLTGQAGTVPTVGFEFVDHLTNNVEQGKKELWNDFYKGIFGFTELQFFDIRGKKTGLLSYALQSPCKTFCIPINEATEEKSQIAEYIREYHGPGIQHIALHSSNLLATLDKLEGQLPTLDIDDDYYDTIFDRVPGVTEDRAHIQRHQVLVDGDDDGYLLQIFTQNMFGPIFFEFIQRKKHEGFGHGNFGALFKSIERDQERRGVL